VILMNEQQWLTIERLGSQAEGVALDFNGPIYVPGALPGEHVLVELYYRRGKQRAGRIVAIEHAAAERGQPFCPIAERCGGCSAQHMSQQAYRQWKQRLATAQLPENVIPEFAFWGGQEQRRRVSLSYRYGKDGVTIGFFAALSHHLVPVPHCPLLIPELNYAIAALQQFLPSILKPRDEGFLHLTQTLQGLDLSWSPHRFKSTDLSSELWQAWGRFGQNFGCARITRAGKDLIAQWHKPYFGRCVCWLSTCFFFTAVYCITGRDATTADARS
jgi:tRNA/tmRNA/rRNA uracil-C5-methylase (TrmA/RlmC/RlmD family)